SRRRSIDCDRCCLSPSEDCEGQQPLSLGKDCWLHGRKLPTLLFSSLGLQLKPDTGLSQTRGEIHVYHPNYRHPEENSRRTCKAPPAKSAAWYSAAHR